MRKWMIPLTIACIFVGMMLAIQMRLESSTQEMKQNNTTVLVSLINNLESEISLRENYLAAIRQQIEETDLAYNADTSEVAELQNILNIYRSYSGSVPLEGSGVIVTIDDRNISSSGIDAAANIIHYQDLLYLVNDLRRGGAEVISINGQRLISSSEIRCVGNTILINTTRLAPPFEIQAIGNPGKLSEAIQSSDTFNRLKSSGFIATLSSVIPQNTLIQIPAYSGIYPTTHMTVIEQDVPENE